MNSAQLGVFVVLYLFFSSLTMVDSFDKYTGMKFLFPKRLIHYQELFNSDNVEIVVYLMIYATILVVLVWLIDVIGGVKNGN